MKGVSFKASKLVVNEIQFNGPIWRDPPVSVTEGAQIHRLKNVRLYKRLLLTHQCTAYFYFSIAKLT